MTTFVKQSKVDTKVRKYILSQQTDSTKSRINKNKTKPESKKSKKNSKPKSVFKI